MQTTLIILKPDAVQRGLMGQIISRFEGKGLQMVGAKMMQISTDLAEEHYAVHKDSPFYEKLVIFMTSSPVLVLAMRGPSAVSVCRNLLGATSGLNATAGTIRGDFGLSKSRNLVHGSDSPESAAQELALFFGGDELVVYDRSFRSWIYDSIEDTSNK